MGEGGRKPKKRNVTDKKTKDTFVEGTPTTPCDTMASFVKHKANNQQKKGDVITEKRRKDSEG